MNIIFAHFLTGICVFPFCFARNLYIYGNHPSVIGVANTCFLVYHLFDLAFGGRGYCHFDRNVCSPISVWLFSLYHFRYFIYSQFLLFTDYVFANLPACWNFSLMPRSRNTALSLSVTDKCRVAKHLSPLTQTLSAEVEQGSVFTCHLLL